MPDVGHPLPVQDNAVKFTVPALLAIVAEQLHVPNCADAEYPKTIKNIMIKYFIPVVFFTVLNKLRS